MVGERNGVAQRRLARGRGFTPVPLRALALHERDAERRSAANGFNAGRGARDSTFPGKCC